MEVLCATQNPGKLKELRELLAPLAITILTPSDVHLADLDVEETGETFAENAELKAKAFAEASGKVSLADDSGLEVKALDNQPGVHSKRVGGSDAERIAWVLSRLATKNDRRARFVSVICIHDPKRNQTECFEGTVDGVVAPAPAGDPDQGFGYDPIFIPDGYDQTFAELGQEIKNTLSHRARALVKAQEYLQQQVKK